MVEKEHVGISPKTTQQTALSKERLLSAELDLLFYRSVEPCWDLVIWILDGLVELSNI